MGTVQEKMWPHVLWYTVPQVPGVMLVALAGQSPHHSISQPCSPFTFQLYLVNHPLGIAAMLRGGWYQIKR